jgi:hypothetical protein
MSALSAHVRLLRRAQRLLPAALRTVAVLAPRGGGCWESSPLSRLPLRSDGRGLIGLRLERGVATAIREQGVAWLQAAVMRSGSKFACVDWRRLRGWGHDVFWSEREDARLALLLDPTSESLWLFWQEESGGSRC